MKKISALIMSLLIAISVLSLKVSKPIKKEEIKEKDKVYDGEVLKPNNSIIMLDYFENDNNTIISPIGITSIINLVSDQDIKQYESIDINYIKEINTPKKEKNELDEYYISLIENVDLNEKIDNIKKLNEKQKLKLITKISKIELAYNTLFKKEKHTLKYIKNYKLTKEQKKLSDIEIYNKISKIKVNYENYTIQNEVKNLNYIYYNKDTFNLPNTILNKKNDYKAKIKGITYNEVTHKDINNSVLKDTNYKISQMVDKEYIENNDLIILNSLYFNYKWEEIIDPDRNSKEEFINNKDKIDILEMMNSIETQYISNKYAKGFIKDFENKKYKFVAFMTTKKAKYINVEELITSIRKETNINVSIPYFNITKLNDLKPYYNDNNIDNLYNIRQKIYFELGDKGTLSTNIKEDIIKSFAIDESNLDLVFNKPFYFLIIDNETNNVLLVGKINDPQKN